MKIKETLLIFLLGLIVGVGVSPLTSSKPQEVLTSPVSVSMAQTSAFHLPLWEGEILGAMVVVPNEQPETIKGAKKTFGEIIQEGFKSDPKVLSKMQEKLVSVEPDNTVNKEETSEDKSKVKSDNIQQNESENKNTEPLSKHSGSLTIAILGDSMVDTMGPGLPYIEKALKKYYPNYFFNLLNYGAGATNVDYGIQRLTSDYEYLGKTIPALVSTNPDIVIVESFAYNPWGADKSALDHHWLSLAKIVDILKERTQAKILFLATIAPNKANFGAGPAGVNWDTSLAWQHAEKINLYLENTVRFAASQGLPVVDVYHPSIVNGDGNLAYINPGDYIHPSVAGCEFVAELIARRLVDLGWIR